MPSWVFSQFRVESRAEYSPLAEGYNNRLDLFTQSDRGQDLYRGVSDLQHCRRTDEDPSEVLLRGAGVPEELGVGDGKVGLETVHLASEVVPGHQSVRHAQLWTTTTESLQTCGEAHENQATMIHSKVTSKVSMDSN